MVVGVLYAFLQSQNEW